MEHEVYNTMTERQRSVVESETKYFMPLKKVLSVCELFFDAIVFYLSV